MLNIEQELEISESGPVPDGLVRDVPGSVAPETVAPETVAPETVAPETVALETVALETVALETVALETVALESATVSRPLVAARLIEYTRGSYVALPPHTTYALIDHPEVVAVPGAAHYAYGLCTWQGARLPLLNLAALFHPDQGAATAAMPSYALIVAYQPVARGPIVYGAIGLETLPQTISVGDEAHCELPGNSRLWPLLALSCFRFEGQEVPILDTSRLFAGYHA